MGRIDEFEAQMRDLPYGFENCTMRGWQANMTGWNGVLRIVRFALKMLFETIAAGAAVITVECVFVMARS